MRHERLYLSDILEASKNIELHIGGKSLDEFVADRTARAAVLHELTVIGEAAARLPATLRERHPLVAWADIVAFRNVVVHQYFGLSWTLIWETATRDVPELERQVMAIVDDEFGGSGGFKGP
jgi:uncharacterized protein with HEPN domain